MSTFQRLTLIGLYNYDNTLFDQLTLPTGYDKPTFVDTFLLEHGEKCVLYTDPDFMKFAIGAVGKKWSLELKEIYKALTAEYNPIYNYDRYEEFKDDTNRVKGETTTANNTSTNSVKYDDDLTHDTTDELTNDLTNELTNDLTDTRTPDQFKETTTYDTTDTTEQVTDGTSERKVSAFNSSSYEPDEKTINNAGKGTVEKDGTVTVETSGSDVVTHTGTATTTDTGTATTTHSGTDKRHVEGKTADVSDKINEIRTGTETEGTTHTAHLFGNIGVTTSAAMVTEVVRQRLDMNLYQLAGRIFANELLIQIY